MVANGQTRNRQTKKDKQIDGQTGREREREKDREGERERRIWLLKVPMK